MGRMIIKKDNGLYAVWSSIVDDFVFDDIPQEDYIIYEMIQTAKKREKDLKELFDEINSGKNPYYQFAMTYKEALKMREEKRK